MRRRSRQAGIFEIYWSAFCEADSERSLDIAYVMPYNMKHLNYHIFEVENANLNSNGS